MEVVPSWRIWSAMVPPVYVIVRVPVSPSDQPRAPSASMAMIVPMVVVDSTLAESALSVDFSTERRAAIGFACVLALPPALSPPPELPPELPPEPPSESEPLQAATPVSAAAIAIETVARRTAVLFIRPPMRFLCLAR